MKRSGPLKRNAPLRRTGRLKPQSDRRRDERDERAAVAAAAAVRDGHCALSGLGDCWGPSDAHELVRRSALPGSHLDPRMVIRLCRHHHAIDDDDPRRAEQLGIRVPGWAWIQYGERALDDARRLREIANAGGSDLPSWRA